MTTKRKNIYSVYALVKDGKCVYIGCSKSPQTRIAQHRKDKDFDKLVVIKGRLTQHTAFACENVLIKFLTLFGDGQWYNAEMVISQFQRIYIREGI